MLRAMIATRKKICLLGTFAVGKTSTVERFVYSRYDERYLSTIGVRVSQKRMPPMAVPGKSEQVQATLLIWDIAAMDRFDSLVENYYRGAAGALAVGDLTRPDSFAQLEEICSRFRSVNPEAALVIVGNKLDLQAPDEATTETMARLARRYGTAAFTTSAKSGENVDAAFAHLVREMGGRA
jgi:small GTP-binding protein